MSFVTTRRMRRCNSEVNLSILNETIQDNSYIQDESMRSLPDVSIANSSRIIELEMQVEQVTQNLEIANKEVDNLTLENQKLKREIVNNQKTIKSLKSLQSPLKELQNQKCLTPKGKLQNAHIPIQKLTKSTMDKCTQSDPKSTTGVSKRQKRKKKLSIKIKHSYKTQQKTIRCICKKLKRMEHERNILLKESKKLEHKINELSMKLRISLQDKLKNNNTEHIKYYEEKKNISTNKIMIFADKLGSGLSVKIKNLCENINISNVCKPGATKDEILRNFDEKTKCLGGSDMAVISIGNCDSYNEEKYIGTIRNILHKGSRKFKLLVTGLIYDKIHDMIIYKINKEIARMASV